MNPNLPTAFVALPEYGLVDPDSREGAYLRAFHDKANPKVNVVSFRAGNSLLAHCFNHCWCRMMNDREHEYSYWVMLHSDISPSAGWLEDLIEELDNPTESIHGTQYGVMHALSPIKNDDGCYSTCLAHGSWDRRWEMKRRLSTAEAQQLPTTFGTPELLALLGTDGFDPPHDDLCLCPNTGCMAIRLSPEWAMFPGFEIASQLLIHDETTNTLRVVREGETPLTGTYIPNCISEDWNLGQWCWRSGLKVGATKRVKLDHMGVHRFNNQQVWGADKDPLFESVKNEPKRIY